MTRPAISLAVLLLLSACAMVPAEAPKPVYTPVSFASLPGWPTDNVEEARPALAASCKRLLTLPDDRSLGADGRMGLVGHWRSFCASLPRQSNLRAYLETSLQPWSLTSSDHSDGLFTGYYESGLRGSLTRHGAYQTPLYKLPPGLVPGGPGVDRASIVNGSLAGRGLELVWLDDKADAFFVQVQGSGRVQLDTGRTLRIGFAGKNGYGYTSIGRQLVERGEMKLEDVSLQSIRAWMEMHPDKADDLMNLNQSYVFFRAMPDDPAAGPEGAAHVGLTPERSLAVDNSQIGYHVPVWLSTDTPQMQRLVVAQDTGGAIKGIVRGDFFWGHGANAEHQAGLMRSTGHYFVLLPKTITP